MDELKIKIFAGTSFAWPNIFAVSQADGYFQTVIVPRRDRESTRALWAQVNKAAPAPRRIGADEFPLRAGRHVLANGRAFLVLELRRRAHGADERVLGPRECPAWAVSTLVVLSLRCVRTLELPSRASPYSLTRRRAASALELPVRAGCTRSLARSF